MAGNRQPIVFEARQVTKRYFHVTALDGADFALRAGEVMAVIGDNQDLAVAPALDIESNLLLGRELRRKGPLGTLFRMLDKPRMRREAQGHLDALRFRIPSIGSAVEDPSGGQRQGVAVARSAAFASKLVIRDEPTAALGMKKSAEVLNPIHAIRDRGLPVILISHNMPHVFEIADRIHIQRLGRRVALTSPREHTMSEIVGIMTGALSVSEPA